MAKRVFLVHGWAGNPENCWFPWLRKELEARNIEVFTPKMPDPENPQIETWVPFLKKEVGNVNEDTYFIGHSIGCQTIMRFLEGLDEKVGGIIFVAGFFNLPFLETEEEKDIARPWLETPINTDKIKNLTKNIIAIFSDDDPDVSLDETKPFKERLDAKIIIEKGMGHFSDDEEITEIPSVLNELLKMTQNL